MIVVTTPTGHIGSQVLKLLLQKNEKMRVLTRNASKLSEEVRSQVEVVEGSLEDSAAVNEAYKGADDLFFVVPPSVQYGDVNDYYSKFGKVTCDAIKKQNVKRVVYVSGTGLGYEQKAGPVSASYLVEEMLRELGADTRILHCGTFMENLMHSVPAIKFKNQFGTSVPPEVKVPWVATKDIAGVAVKLLVDTTWSGNDSVAVLGADDLSYGEIAEIMSEVLGRKIQYQVFAEETLKTTMIHYGASEAAAQGLVDIYSSMKNGVFNRVKRTSKNTSPTTFVKWCTEVFKPAVLN